VHDHQWTYARDEKTSPQPLSCKAREGGRGVRFCGRGEVAPPFVPEGQPILAHRFNGGYQAPTNSRPGGTFHHARTIQSGETVGYNGMSLRDKKYGGQ